MRYFILLPFLLVLCGCQGHDSDIDSEDHKPMVSEIRVGPTRTKAAFIVSQKPPHRPWDIKIWTLDLNTGATVNTHLETSLGYTSFSWAPDESAVAYKNHSESEIHLFAFGNGDDKRIGTGNESAPPKVNRGIAPRQNTLLAADMLDTCALIDYLFTKWTAENHWWDQRISI